MLTTENNLVEDWMSKNIIAIDPDVHMHKIKEMFEEFEVHHLLVVKGGTLLGIISTHDLLKCYSESGEIFGGTLAKDIMTSNPLSIDTSDSVGLAADIILANKFHALPVLDGDDLVGIITSHDLIKFAFK
jgi:CBS domain-containing protein